METLIEENSKLESHEVADLQVETIKVLREIEDFVQFNDYQYNKPPEYVENILFNAINNLSLNERRKIKKSINIFRKKQSITSANRLYHYIYAKVLKIDYRVRINYPVKHLLIQKKREIYLKYREEMEKALAEYKAEKKDYYNARLQRGQKVQ